MSDTMSSLERVLTSLGHREPDRVPLFLLANLHGAKETGLSIKEYFSKASNVVEGQARLRAKYGGDCFMGFFNAAMEAQAWGGEIVYFDDGPPNAGEPPVKGAAAIMRMEAPRVKDCPGLQRVLDAVRGMKERSGGEVPILGVTVSPFSLPVMQLGFGPYLDLMHGDEAAMGRLMALNEDFCVEWANAQLDAGATAICYFDPVSSPTITTPGLSRKYGFPAAQRAIARFKGPAAVHFASGRCIPILDSVAGTGALAIGVSAQEDLGELKKACGKRLALVGNLNAVEMRHWTPAQAAEEAGKAIRAAGAGGGFILSDNHGEIPFQVPDEILLAVSGAVRESGRYPIVGADGSR
jgi:uroporphyrinogen decarboxylase